MDFTNVNKLVYFVLCVKVFCNILLLLLSSSLLSSLFITFMQGIYNYTCIPETNYVSSVYSVATFLNYYLCYIECYFACEMCCVLLHYRGADKSLATPGRKLQRQKIFSFIYPIYNHNCRNISNIYIYNKTSIKTNILTIKQNTMGSKSS
jgi:hypothetical protein